MHKILHKNDVLPFLQYMTDIISGAGIAIPSGALNLIQFLLWEFVFSFCCVLPYCGKKTSFFS
jgi:hypothetical protein